MVKSIFEKPGVRSPPSANSQKKTANALSRLLEADFARYA
jgi:hypothetical protein